MSTKGEGDSSKSQETRLSSGPSGFWSVRWNEPGRSASAMRVLLPPDWAAFFLGNEVKSHQALTFSKAYRRLKQKKNGIAFNLPFIFSIGPCRRNLQAMTLRTGSMFVFTRLSPLWEPRINRERVVPSPSERTGKSYKTILSTDVRFVRFFKCIYIDFLCHLKMCAAYSGVVWNRCFFD